MNKDIDFNELAKQIFEQNRAVGWWDDMDRCVFQSLQLVSTEIAEATEGERKNLMDDKLPHRRMGEVELADALIRILDLGGRYGWGYKYKFLYEDMSFRLGREDQTTGSLHLLCNMALYYLAEDIYQHGLSDIFASFGYSQLINTILIVGDKLKYDIVGAMYEKLEFNKHREDHKRENRALENGKKF